MVARCGSLSRFGAGLPIYVGSKLAMQLAGFAIGELRAEWRASVAGWLVYAAGWLCDWLPGCLYGWLPILAIWLCDWLAAGFFG